MADTPDPAELLRSRRYVGLLVLAALIGVPISAASWGFLWLVDKLQTEIFTDLPKSLGFDSPPAWWPLPPLLVAGLIVGFAIRYLPGRGGHSPADGFHTGDPPTPVTLPGIALAALATLAGGAVLGPEAPLIALGGGLAICAVRLIKSDAPRTAQAVVAAAGSFAAISTLLGSPLLGAFLLMEAAGLSGAMLGVVLLPGLLAAGVGSLIFIGLDSWTGVGTFSLTLPSLPHVGQPTIAEFGWALLLGLTAALLGAGIRWLGLFLRPYVERRLLLLTPVAGLVVAGLAILFAQTTDHPTSDVLFSGQNQMGPLISTAGAYSLGAMLLLIACKSLAYGVSLSSFRGGPVFPSMFIGAAGGIAFSHLPGLVLVTAVAMGIGAMATAMLKLPFTSVLLATLLLGADGLAVMPVVIVAVVVSYVVTARLAPAPAPAPEQAPPAETPAPEAEPAASGVAS
jgi:H+/Cl- antiporter ClcA